ncbi:hypothetical protein D3C77_386550 [compost metagenome]
MEGPVDSTTAFSKPGTYLCKNNSSSRHCLRPSISALLKLYASVASWPRIRVVFIITSPGLFVSKNKIFSRGIEISPFAFASLNRLSKPPTDKRGDFSMIEVSPLYSGKSSGCSWIYCFTRGISTLYIFIFSVIGCVAPSDSRPTVYSAPAPADKSPSPVASMNIRARISLSPDLLHTVMPVIFPSSVFTPASIV